MVTFKIDKTAPVVTGITNNGFYNKVVSIKFNEGTATLNGKSFRNGITVYLNGAYTLLVKDVAGNITSVKFTIDNTAPVVTGVTNNGLYNKVVTINFNEGTAKLNGAYTLVVKDKAGNITTVKFTIDTKRPIAPYVDKVTSKATKVTGKAEAGSTIVIKVGKKIIGTGKADKYGKFTVSISKQKASTILYVTAKDKAGNVSSATKITVRK